MEYLAPIIIMNANLFRCGWCGCPTQTDGKPLDGVNVPQIRIDF